MTRRLRRARFEQQVTLEEFNFAASPKLLTGDVVDVVCDRVMSELGQLATST